MRPVKIGGRKKILIINNAEPGITEFSKPIKVLVKNSGLQPASIEYSECPDYNFVNFSGIILTGSPQGNDIVEHHLPYYQWIKTCTTPILGICAGHHISGFLFGSELLRRIEPESGDFNVEVLTDDPIFNNMPKVFKVKQMHNDSITLPEGFKLLATSKTCKNQLMKHKTKPLYTCQFHPEFYNPDLIINFIRMAESRGQNHR